MLFAIFINLQVQVKDPILVPRIALLAWHLEPELRRLWESHPAFSSVTNAALQLSLEDCEHGIDGFVGMDELMSIAMPI